MTIKKTVQSFSQMRLDTLELIRQINQDGFVPHVVFAPSRGGLLLGTMISHYWDIPLVPFQWQTRDHCTTDSETLRCESHKWIQQQANILIVDDIVDSGKTFREISEFFASSDTVKYATLYQKIFTSGIAVDYVANSDMESDFAWVEFPYEEWWRKND